MKKYLVGGAVRDKLLNLPIKERDWVIVGSNTQNMLNLGYTQVGKDFPVFLHPDNQEEYALARTERKFRKGHTGFTCYTSPKITIEEDLSRRDLTINAMAYDNENGNLIDPYHGQKDIQLRILRHVSNSFYEDPLRVLRVARFSARFAHLNFKIAPETKKIMTQMIYELSSLSPERIWIETKKALLTKNPQVYFQVLRCCGALKILFPELNTLFDIPYSITQHQKISIGNDVMTKLSRTVYITNDLSVRFAVLCHRLNEEKITFKKHHHNYSSHLLSVNNFIKRLRIPKKIYSLAKIVPKYYKYLSCIEKLPSNTLIALFKAFDCWRQPKRFEQIILIAKTHITTPINHNNYIFFQEKFLRQAFMITKNITPDNIIKDGFTGINIKKELLRKRLYALKKWKKHNIF